MRNLKRGLLGQDVANLRPAVARKLIGQGGAIQAWINLE